MVEKCRLSLTYPVVIECLYVLLSTSSDITNIVILENYGYHLPIFMLFALLTLLQSHPTLQSGRKKSRSKATLSGMSPLPDA